MFALSGCSLVGINKNYYKRDLPPPPKKEMRSYESTEAMMAGTTLLTTLSEKAFYEGLQPKSKEADTIRDLAWRGMAVTGVLYNAGALDSPEALTKYLTEVESKYDIALKEERQRAYNLEKAVEDYQQKLLTSDKMKKDKEAEMEAMNGKWSVTFANLKFWIWFIVCVLALIPIGLFIAQVFTGIPLFTGFMKTFIPWASGGIKTIFNGFKQTAEAIEETKKELKAEIEKKKAENKGYEAQGLEYGLSKLLCNLGKTHDNEVKKYIKNELGVNK
jgi:hypothetical protein